MNRMQRVVARLYGVVILVMMAFPPFELVLSFSTGEITLPNVHRGWFFLLTPPAELKYLGETFAARVNLELLLVQFLSVTLALGALYLSLGGAPRREFDRANPFPRKDQDGPQE